MKIGILAIGNELIRGTTQDTNSSFMSRELTAQGWNISAIMIVGDDKSAIGKGLYSLLTVSDAVIVTGGLGPTSDDITTASIAAALNLGLYTDETVKEKIMERFKKHGIKWTTNNARQAVFPEGATPIPNPTGSAWGFFLKKNGRILAAIPGVPSEVKGMLREGVIPIIRREARGAVEHIESRTIKIFGPTEAAIDQIIQDIDLKITGMDIGFYPHFPENHIVITSRNPSRSAAKENLEAAEKQIREKLGKNIFGYDSDTMEGVVASLLKQHNLTLSVAESCTGGLITDRLTDIPGSSAFLDRGVVVYSNASKTKILGVPASVISAFGAVSEETAVFMAEGVRKTSGTDIGLATTGIAGPTGGGEQKPVGTVFIALTDGKDTICRRFLFRWDRRRIKKISSSWALEMLRRYLIGNEDLNDKRKTDEGIPGNRDSG